MDIVIPYKNSASNGLELRYTLRGIERYAGDVGNIFIIGDCPDYVRNVIHVPAKSSTEKPYKQLNIYHKLAIACLDKRVSNSFLWMCDDHFLLKPLEPNYDYRATLQQSIDKFTHHQSYRQTLENTQRVLNDGLDYGHGPMVLEKDRFMRAMDYVDWHKRWGYAIKSLYCGLNGIEGNQYPDLKIKRPMNAKDILRLISGRTHFSIDDRGLNADMVQVLDYLYPKQSIYERASSI